MPHLRPLLLLTLLSLSTAGDASAQFTSYFGRNKIQYEDFDWHVLRTEHFDIYHYPEMQALAEYGAAFAEEAYREIEARFAFSLTHRVPLIFYSSNLHFKQTNVTPGFIPDGVGGFFEFLKGRVVVPANGDLHQFRRVIRHEIVHVFTFTRLVRVMRDHRVPAQRFLPLWFTEGLAEYWSGGRDHQHEMVMRDAVFSNALVSPADIHRIRGSFAMYKHGEALMHFLAETYGEEVILRIIENFWMESDFRGVLAYTLSEPFDEVNRKWLAWVRGYYLPMLADAEAPSVAATVLRSRDLGVKPLVYRRRDGTRSLIYVGNRTGYTNVYSLNVDDDFRPIREPREIIHGERTDDFEAFHVLESRMSISNDGRLAFVTKSGAQDVIHIFDLEREALLQTFGFDDAVAIYSPDWSPDGSRLVFSSIGREGFSDLFVLDIETGRRRSLTDDEYDDRDPAWSPDGRRIVFSSDRGPDGRSGAYSLFLLDLDSRSTEHLTSGRQRDMAPRWSPDGRHVIFSSARRDSTGRFGAQDIWVVDAPTEMPLASRGSLPPSSTASVAERRITSLTTAAFDPVWTDEDELLFTAFEDFRFTMRYMPGLDSLVHRLTGSIDARIAADTADVGAWRFERLSAEADADVVPYRRRYQLDIAQGSVSQTPLWGTTGGAMLAFSDVLGDDYWFLTLYNASRGRGSFLQNLNVAVSRLELHRRANIGYGLYRFGGLRYDLTDPDAVTELPIVWESIYGGFGSISYPLSHFRRIELSTSLSWDEREVPVRQLRRSALLVSGSASFVHDNALYSYSGPMDGSRLNLTVGYTGDVRNRNVGYVTLIADGRRYIRLAPQTTFASWGMFRLNHGREARLFFLGGSWDLRGWRFFDIRAQKMWFTSHELRFPLVNAPSFRFPVLQPFGITSIRGSLFIDAVHAWNDDYYRRIPQLNTGETLGSAGAGLRFVLFGGFVLRYDVGYRFRDGFRTRERFFRQFFFGYDF